jgi:hypothetical protein
LYQTVFCYFKISCERDYALNIHSDKYQYVNLSRGGGDQLHDHVCALNIHSDKYQCVNLSRGGGDQLHDHACALNIRSGKFQCDL